MASLLQKINTLISANIHGLVDSALEANSVKVMDEYIRQAERNLDALEDSAATVGGTVKTLKRKYEEFASAAEKLDRDIDTLLMRGKSDLATAAQAEMNQKQQLAQEYYEQWQSQEQEYRRMLDAKPKQHNRQGNNNRAFYAEKGSAQDGPKCVLTQFITFIRQAR